MSVLQGLAPCIFKTSSKNKLLNIKILFIDCKNLRLSASKSYHSEMNGPKWTGSITYRRTVLFVSYILGAHEEWHFMCLVTLVQKGEGPFCMDTSYNTIVYPIPWVQIPNLFFHFLYWNEFQTPSTHIHQWSSNDSTISKSIFSKWKSIVYYLISNLIHLNSRYLNSRSLECKVYFFNQVFFFFFATYQRLI